jgi:hypothetical protein
MNLIDAAGQEIIANVRDRAIREMLEIIDGTMKGEFAEADRVLLNSGRLCADIVREFVPRIVDRTLFAVMVQAQESETVALVAVDEKGSPSFLDELSEGLPSQMHDWIERFSSYPHPYRSR